MTPDVNELIEAIRAALSPPSRPSQADGWYSMEELRQVMARDGVIPSATTVRRRLAAQANQWERRKVHPFTYFRLRNGKP